MVKIIRKGHEREYGSQGQFIPPPKHNNKNDILKRPYISYTTENTGKIKILSISQISDTIPIIPDVRELEKKLSEEMEATAEWVPFAEAINLSLKKYIPSQQKAGASIGLNALCSALTIRLTNGDITYYRDSRKGYPITTYKETKTETTEQGTMTEGGRLGGPDGWSFDKNMIAYGLKHFIDNIVGLMIAFFGRAKLPLTNSVTLPNIDPYHTEGFIPPLSMSYHIAPYPLMVNTIKIISPTDASIHTVVWDSDKNEIAKTSPISIQAGTTEIVTQTTLSPFQNKGFLNIEVDYAPQGIIIDSITVFPPTFEQLSKKISRSS